MKNKFVLLASLALIGGLVSCGTQPSASSTPAGENSNTPTASSSQPSGGNSGVTPSSSTPAVPKDLVKDDYEKVFNYFSIPEGKTVKQMFYHDVEAEGESVSKHYGPNYALALTLLKAENKAVLTRKLIYQVDMFANTVKGGFTLEGTWSKNADGTYKVNIPAYTPTRGISEYEAVELNSDANGDIIVKYAYGSTEKLDEEGNKVQDVDEEGNPKTDASGNPVYVKVNKTYETKMYTQPDFEGEYQGTYYSITDRDDGLDSTVAEEHAFEEIALTATEKAADVTSFYDVKGAIEDSGISALQGEVDEFGVFTGVTPRLDGTINGIFYKDSDGKAKLAWHMEARERHSVCIGEQL